MPEYLKIPLITMRLRPTAAFKAMIQVIAIYSIFNEMLAQESAEPNFRKSPPEAGAAIACSTCIGSESKDGGLWRNPNQRAKPQPASLAGGLQNPIPSDPRVAFDRLHEHPELNAISKVIVQQTCGVDFNPDPQRKDDGDCFDENKKLLIGKKLYTSGTGFMISPCLMMTAYHVVGEKTKVFVVGIGQPDPANPSANDSKRHKYIIKAQFVGGSGGGDWSILKLEKVKAPDQTMRNVGDLVGYLRWMLTDPEDIAKKLSTCDRNIIAAGYPVDKPSGVLWGVEHVKIFNIDEVDIRGDAQSRPGASGAPLVCYTNDKKHPYFVIGLLLGHDPDTGISDIFNLTDDATKISEIIHDPKNTCQ